MGGNMDDDNMTWVIDYKLKFPLIKNCHHSFEIKFTLNKDKPVLEGVRCIHCKVEFEKMLSWL